MGSDLKMDKAFHTQNRQALYQSIEKNSVVLLFSGTAPRKTADEYYPFFANRNFVYMTGIQKPDSVFMAVSENGTVQETLFILPKDKMAERWTGSRLTPEQAEDACAIADIKSVNDFEAIFLKAVQSEKYENIYMDFDRLSKNEPDSRAYELAELLKKLYPYIKLKNLSSLIKSQRTIKKDCEIQAMKTAQKITRQGIIAMMKASRPGLYEYQLKAEFDYALAQNGVLSPAFPSIISSGKNNFFIHYYDYSGICSDGDMVLNDVGACWDNECNDVSRGWPCNGRFSEKQKLLYSCAYNTSEHMFGIIKPGMLMKSVDETIRRFTFEQLKDIGLCKNFEDIGTYMWHGGSHHVGYDVHDWVIYPQVIEPGMVFCVDVGIYCEEWGIGFRLEDNCLVTDTGCANLSGQIPRTIEDIEAIMQKQIF